MNTHGLMHKGEMFCKCSSLTVCQGLASGFVLTYISYMMNQICKILMGYDHLLLRRSQYLLYSLERYGLLSFDVVFLDYYCFKEGFWILHLLLVWHWSSITVSIGAFHFLLFFHFHGFLPVSWNLIMLYWYFNHSNSGSLSVGHAMVF